MKKLFAIALATVLVMALAACNVNVNTPTLPVIGNGGAAAPAGTTAAPAGEVETTAPADGTQPTTEPTTEPATEPTTEPTESADAADFLGYMNGDTYVNEYIGMSCDLSGYTVDTLDGLITRNGLAAGATAADIQAKAEAGASAIVLFATNTDINNTMNIVLQCADTSTLTDADMKATLEAIIPTLIAQYEGMGYTEVACEYSTIQIDGQTKHALLMEGLLQGNEFGLLMFMYTGDNFVASVTMGGLDTDALLETVDTIKLN